MIRRSDGTFRTVNIPGSNVSPGRMNVSDDTFRIPGSGASSVTSEWTNGATLLDPVRTLFPPQAETVNLVGFSVSGHMLFGVGPNFNSNPKSMFGRLGRVVTGLTTLGNQTQGSGSTPWESKFLQLPNDLTLIGDLWNPALHDLPPQYFRNQAGGPDQVPGGTDPLGLQVGISQTLAQPVPIPRGQNLMMGIWVLPSIMVNDPLFHGPGIMLQVLDAAYSLVYDDGQQ